MTTRRVEIERSLISCLDLPPRPSRPRPSWARALLPRALLPPGPPAPGPSCPRALLPRFCTCIEHTVLRLQVFGLGPACCLAWGWEFWPRLSRAHGRCLRLVTLDSDPSCAGVRQPSSSARSRRQRRAAVQGPTNKTRLRLRPTSLPASAPTRRTHPRPPKLVRNEQHGPTRLVAPSRRRNMATRNVRCGMWFWLDYPLAIGQPNGA